MLGPLRILFAPFRLLRNFIVLLAVLVVLLVIGVVGTVVYMDSVAKELVERGTSAALGVESSTEAVNVSLWRRSVDISGLAIANPEGYTQPQLLEADTLNVHVDTDTLFSDVIVVPLVEIDGVTLNVEQQNGRNNIAAVLDYLQKGRTEDRRQRFQVDRVVIRDITANVELVQQLGGLSTVPVHIPEIVLDDVATDEGRGVAVAEITRRIAPAIVAAVLEQGDQLPDNVTRLLTENLAGLAEDAGGEVARIIGEVGGDLLEQTIGGFTEGLNRLLNGSGGEQNGDANN